MYFTALTFIPQNKNAGPLYIMSGEYFIEIVELICVSC